MRFQIMMLCAASLLTATACAPIGRGAEQIADAAHSESVKFDHSVRDWFDSENEADEPKQQKQVKATYCYGTLGETECYANPQPGQELRFAGKQVPDAVFNEYDYPAPEAYKPPVPTPVLAESAPAAGGKHYVQDGVVYQLPEGGAVKASDVPDYRMPRELPAPF